MTANPSKTENSADGSLQRLNPGDSSRFASDTMWPVFDRLRKEDPIHFTPESEFGPYWSITKYNDIMAVETDHKTFSSEPEIMLRTDSMDEASRELQVDAIETLITLDPPRHELHRKAIQPALSPTNLLNLEPLIRERAGKILDDLPIGEEFDWVDKVSKELTAMTLATLFGTPQEDRRKLTHWSDVLVSIPGPGMVVETPEERWEAMREFTEVFTQLWAERANKEPQFDLISMMAHNPQTNDLTPGEIFGTSAVLTIGGNDTTRNTISGSVYALNKYPAQNAKLRANPSLLPSMISETVRWQTPISHMMRRATRDVDFRDKQIKQGDSVVMWYISGNRDDEVIENPYEYIIDRKNPSRHLAFGFGIHRCVGNRLAELQLRVIWEEILKRFPEIIVIGEPKRTGSNFTHGYEQMTVTIPRRN